MELNRNSGSTSSTSQVIDTQAPYKAKFNSFKSWKNKKDNRMFTRHLYAIILFDSSFSLALKTFACFYVFGLRDLHMMQKLRSYSSSILPWRHNIQCVCNEWIPYNWFHFLNAVPGRLADANIAGGHLGMLDEIWKSYLDMWYRMFFKDSQIYVDYDDDTGISLYSQIDGFKYYGYRIPGLLESLDADQYRTLQSNGFNSFFLEQLSKSVGGEDEEWWILFGPAAMINHSNDTPLTMSLKNYAPRLPSEEFVEYIVQIQCTARSSDIMNRPREGSTFADKSSLVMFHHPDNFYSVTLETCPTLNDNQYRDKDGDISYSMIHQNDETKVCCCITHREVYHGIRIIMRDIFPNYIPLPKINMNEKVVVKHPLK